MAQLITPLKRVSTQGLIYAVRGFEGILWGVVWVLEQLARLPLRAVHWVMIAFVVLGVGYALATPPLEAQGERLFFAQIFPDTAQTLEETLTLNPRFQESLQVSGDKNRYLIASTAPFSSSVLAVRLFNLGVGVATLWIVYQLGRIVSPSRPSVALLGMALTAFNPMFAFSVVSVSPFALGTFGLSALLWWVLSALLGQSWVKRSSLLMAVVGVIIGVMGLFSVWGSTPLEGDFWSRLTLFRVAYWGIFGAFNVSMDVSYVVMTQFLTLIGLAGGVFATVQLLAIRDFEQAHRELIPLLSLWLMNVVSVLLYFVWGDVRYALLFVGTASVLLAVGWVEWVWWGIYLTMPLERSYVQATDAVPHEALAPTVSKGLGVFAVLIVLVPFVLIAPHYRPLPMTNSLNSPTLPFAFRVHHHAVGEAIQRRGDVPILLVGISRDGTPEAIVATPQGVPVPNGGG